MIGLLVVTHGNLARELVGAARRIVGEVDRLEAVSIDWDVDVDRARTAIEQAVGRLGTDVVILTDMFGGTPSNIALSLLEPGKVEVVTGVNLPMVIKFTNLREQLSTGEVANRIAAQGRQAIQVASEVLAPKSPDDDREPGA